MAMSELKGTSHIVLRSFLKGFAIVLFGALISAIGFFWGWHLIWDDLTGVAGFSGALIFLVFPIIFFGIEFWTAVLMTFCLISPFLYILLAYKISLISAFNDVWGTHLNKPALMLLKNFFKHLSKKDKNWGQILKRSKKIDYLLKGQESFKQLPFFQRTLISFGLKKIRIGEILETCRSEDEWAQKICVKIEDAIQNSLVLSKRLFYILATIQGILMVLAYFLQNK